MRNRESLPPSWEPDDTALSRYLAGEVVGTERIRISAWLEAHVDKAERLSVIQQAARLRTREDDVASAANVRRQFWTSVREAGDPGFLHRHLFDKTGANAGGTRDNGTTGTRTRSARMIAPRRSRSLQLVLTGLCVGIIGLIAGQYSNILQLFSHQSVSLVTYTTGKGQRATVTLSDGSVVNLNVESQLYVPSNYATGNHSLRLSGEALFTVHRHSNIPFTVTTESAVTRVLGTTFLIRQYQKDSLATVAVREGKVVIRSVVLTERQKVQVTRDKVMSVQPIDEGEFSFVRGVLTLHGITFSKAIDELSRWYDADIRLGDPSLANRHIVAEFAVGSLADLTDILEGAFNVRVVRSGRILTLYGRE
jgi:ferric-dicitrate binding protein FerR (iron transport regulator)